MRLHRGAVGGQASSAHAVLDCTCTKSAIICSLASIPSTAASHIYTLLFYQTSAFAGTDITPAAVSQQVSAVSSLVASNPDEVSPASKLSATNFMKTLASNIDSSDKNAAKRILQTVGALARSTLRQDSANKAGGSRRLLAGSVPGYLRAGVSTESQFQERFLDSSSARDLVESTRDTVNSLGTSLLSETTPGEEPTIVQVCLGAAIAAHGAQS